MKIYDVLEVASLENIAGDPVAQLADGRVWLNTSTSVPKLRIGGATVEFVMPTATQTLTNKTIDANNSTITNLAHGAEVDDPSSGVHGVTGDVVGTGGAQTLSSKTINTSVVDLSTTVATDSNKMVVSAEDTAGLVALTRAQGGIYYDTDLGNFVGDNGATLEPLGGGGAGGINFIGNGSAEASTTGWDDFDDGAVSVPVDGTPSALTGLATLAVTSAAPLLGAGSFRMVRSAAAQGEGHSYAFSIDAGFAYKVMEVKFLKDFSDANIADGDISCWIYDVTNSTLIEPVGFELTADTQDACLTFQATNSLSYRLIFMVTVTDATAFTADFDNVSVGPADSCGSSDSPVILSSYVNTTAQTFGVGVSTTVLFNEILEDNTGSFNTGTGVFTAPESSYYNVECSAWVAPTAGSPTSGVRVLQVYKNGSGGTRLSFSRFSATDIAESSSQTTFKDGIYLEKGETLEVIFYNNTDVSLKLDWGQEFTYFTVTKSAIGCSAGADAVIGATATLNTAQSLPAGSTQTVAWDVIEHDTTNSFDAVTNNDYTVPESGLYWFGYTMRIDSGVGVINFQIWMSINGSGTYGFQSDTNITDSVSNPYSGFYSKELVKGDVINVRALSSGATSSMSAGGGEGNVFTVFKVPSGGSCGQSSEVVAIAESTAAQSVTAAGNDFIAGTVVKDSTGSYNNATGEFTCPRSGTLTIDCAIRTDNTILSTSEVLAVSAIRNGGGTEARLDLQVGTGGAVGKYCGGSSVFDVVKGDVFKVNLSSSQTLNLTANAFDNRLSFKMD